MNELDWWIASQWEMFKIKEGKTGLEFNKTDKEGNVLTVDRTQKWNKLRAKTDLKEMYIVRYADDFKLFCRDYATAKKVMCATKLWLAEICIYRPVEKSRVSQTCGRITLLSSVSNLRLYQKAVSG